MRMIAKAKVFGGACLVRPATCVDSGGHCFDGGICDSPETNESIGDNGLFFGSNMLPSKNSCTGSGLQALRRLKKKPPLPSTASSSPRVLKPEIAR